MKKRFYIIIGAVAVFTVATAATWLTAFNGEVKKNAEVITEVGQVHASLGGRYDKVVTLIDAIEGATEAVTSYMTIIKEARVAFAEAIASSNIKEANDQANIVDTTFMNLVALFEDNPDSYTTIPLVSEFMGEFSASTNAVIYNINIYNKKVEAYNIHIKTFPNVIFLGRKAPYEIWAIANYNATLPTFK